MYHRILPEDDPRYEEEEPGMVVTPDTFRSHIRWIREKFELVRLKEWVEGTLQGRSLPRRAVAITFDDGWRDNFEFGLPVLIEEKAPATLFVASDFIGTGRVFWPHRLVRILGDNRIYSCSSDDAQWLRERCQVERPWSRAVIASVIKRAKLLDEDELIPRLDQLEERWKIERNERSLLSWREIELMVASGYIDIGSHSCTHLRMLARISRETLLREIVGSKKRIESELKQEVALFCYPNGDFTQDAQAIVSEHYLAAVTTIRGSNTLGTPLHSLKRIALHEDVAGSRHSFLARLGGL